MSLRHFLTTQDYSRSEIDALLEQASAFKRLRQGQQMFSHCLPLRRNVKAADAVMDSPACIAIDEAENRLHVQKAVMTSLLSQPGPGAGDRGPDQP